MSIIAIESAYDLAIMFGDKELAAVYREALVEAGVHYKSKTERRLQHEMGSNRRWRIH